MRKMQFLLKITRSDMAFNPKVFKTRAITAVIFAVIMLAGLFLSPILFILLFSIIHFGCWWEYLSLVEKIQLTKIHIYVKLGMMVIGYALMLWLSGWNLEIGNYSIIESLVLPVSAAGFAILLIGIFQKTPLRIKTFFTALAGLVYISMSWGFMLDLYFVDSIVQLNSVPQLNVLLIGTIPPVIVISIWINDTMAYIVGSFIGRTPLSPISPKKTWEGTIGGIVLAVAVSSLLCLYVFNFSKNFSWYHWVIIPAIAAITGTIGDLFESKLKRMAGVKDSGSFMPGHGGFLDRFDSLLFAVTFVWIYVTLFF